MAIALPANMADDTLNTVAVVPFELPSATAAHSSSSSLAAAASNLISAIAQGTATNIIEEDRSDVGSEEGSSSFTYTAPAGASTDTEQQGWYASTPYHISNRYYDADITLKATKAALSSSSNNAAQNANTVLSQSYPAYVAVVDRSRSLEHHRLLAASLESRIAAGFDADISIVAGVSIISSSNSQLITAVDDDVGSSSRRQQISQTSTRAKISDLVALYADHGWEFIPIDEIDGDELDGDLGSNADGEDGFSDTSRDDEMDGIERIREALMNHMWNGLVRKDQPVSSSIRNASSDEPSAMSTAFAHSSFSDAIDRGFESDRDEAHGEGTLDVPRDRAPTATNLTQNLPALDPNTHAEASDLDEHLAKLFLASSGSADFAKLEAFLESEDPSWPAPSTRPSRDDAPPPFDDDFDDFLPFQSGPSVPRSTEVEDLPSMDDISQMQNRLFGANTAARLEAGPLGMGNQASEGDLASQLSQLQWHAQRVRNIQDPDQRRKEAALVALAFSMQWSTDGEADAGTMAF